MRLHLSLSITFLLILSACDPARNTRPIRVVASPELLDRQSCQFIKDAQRKPQEEVVLTGTASHGSPDTLRISCEGQEHRIVIAFAPPPDDLGMKELRRQWTKKTSKNDQKCSSCPKYNITARFVGELTTAGGGDKNFVLYVVRTADRIRKSKIRYATEVRSGH